MLRCQAIASNSGGNHPCRATGRVWAACARQQEKEGGGDSKNTKSCLWRHSTWLNLVVLQPRLRDFKGTALYWESQCLVWSMDKHIIMTKVTYNQLSKTFSSSETRTAPEFTLEVYHYHGQVSPVASTPLPPSLPNPNPNPAQCWMGGFPLDNIINKIWHCQ